MKPLYKIFLALIFLTFGATWVVAEPIDQLLIKRVMSEYELDSLTYEVELVSNRLKVTEAESEELTLQAISNKEPLGLFTMQAVITRDNEVVSKGQVRLRIHKYQIVLVSLDRIKRHDLIEETKLVLKRMDVTSLRQQPASEPGMLAGFRARLNIRKDQIITTELIEPVPDIEVGHEVTIILHTDLLEITAPGRAMQSGCKGTVIRVKNKATGKVILGRIIDKESVAVDI